MWDVKTNAAGLRRGRLSHLYDSHWQIEYRIRAAGAECMFMGFANRCYLSQHLLILHFFLPSGQIQEVTLSQEEPANQVEVTPELDLEVVPESSGDWHVFPWPQTTKPQSQKALYSVLSTDWVLELNSKALPNIFLSLKRVIWLEKGLDIIDLLHCISRAFTLVAVPCCLSKLTVK